MSHEIRFAQSVADQVESGPPEQVLADPLQDRTRTFLRRVLDPI